MASNRLTPETFLAVTEMVAGHLRLKDADRWTPHICRLKFHSFQSEFPEVNEPQFMWAAEQWIQSLDPKQFKRYPTWRELMAPLYRSEGGLANRSWGFRDELPKFCQPTAEQLAQLPRERRSILPAPDVVNPEAYVPFHAGLSDMQVLPPAKEQGSALTPERWQKYLAQVQEG